MHKSIQTKNILVNKLNRISIIFLIALSFFVILSEEARAQAKPQKCLQLFNMSEVFTEAKKSKVKIKEDSNTEVLESYKLSDQAFYDLNKKYGREFLSFWSKLGLREILVRARYFFHSEDIKVNQVERSYKENLARNKELNNSILSRVETLAGLKAEKIKQEILKIVSKNEIDLQSQTKSIVEELSPIYVDFEVNFLQSLRLAREIITRGRALEQFKIEQSGHPHYLKTLQAKEKMLKAKIREKYFFDKLIARHYHEYKAIRNMLEEQSLTENKFIVEYIQEKMKKYATTTSVRRGFSYRQFKLSEISYNIGATGTTFLAMIKHDLASEIWLKLKLFSINAVVIGAVKTHLASVPSGFKELADLNKQNSGAAAILTGWRAQLSQQLEKLSKSKYGAILSKINPQKVLSSGLEVLYNSHKKDFYSENILQVLLQRTPEGMFNKLESLNSESEFPNELLLIFARVTEHAEYWQLILDHAQKPEVAQMKPEFVKTLLEIDKLAGSSENFDFYYDKPYSLKFGNVAAAVGLVGLAYGGYIPGVDQLIDLGKSLVDSIASVVR